MDVTGDFVPEGPYSRSEPSDPAAFYIEDVYIGEQEVTHLIRPCLAEIESAALDWCERNPAEVRKQAMESFSPSDDQVEARV